MAGRRRRRWGGGGGTGSPGRGWARRAGAAAPPARAVPRAGGRGATRRPGGGPPISWRANYTDRIEYANFWNDYGVLWLQIESLSAITRAKTFARPGVDVLSWGPADLTFNREANPYHPLKTDDDCIEHVLKLLGETETKLCIRSYKPELRNKYLDMGATVLIEIPSV